MQVLTFVNRQWIEFFNNKGQGPREIGRFLRRDHTVVSRELQRNTKPGKKYSAVTAQKLADFKAKKTNKRKHPNCSIHCFLRLMPPQNNSAQKIKLRRQ